MSHLVKNATDAFYRTVEFELYAPDGSPFTGVLTGVKFHWKINGTGTEQTSTADVARVTAGQATVLGVLTQAESNTFTAGHNVAFYVKPSGTDFVGWDVWKKIYAAPWAFGLAEIARAVFRALHYADGYGVSRNSGDTAMVLTVPGESTTNVNLGTDTGRPTVTAAGAGVP